MTNGLGRFGVLCLLGGRLHCRMCWAWLLSCLRAVAWEYAVKFIHSFVYSAGKRAKYSKVWHGLWSITCNEKATKQLALAWDAWCKKHNLLLLVYIVSAKFVRLHHYSLPLLRQCHVLKPLLLFLADHR